MDEQRTGSKKFREFALALLQRVGPLEGLSEQDALDQPEAIVDAVAKRIDQLESQAKTAESEGKATYKKYVTALQLAGIKPATVERVLAEKEAESEEP
jgi:hypothetical protein